MIKYLFVGYFKGLYGFCCFPQTNANIFSSNWKEFTIMLFIVVSFVLRVLYIVIYFSCYVEIEKVCLCQLSFSIWIIWEDHTNDQLLMICVVFSYSSYFFLIRKLFEVTSNLSLLKRITRVIGVLLLMFWQPVWRWSS